MSQSDAVAPVQFVDLHRAILTLGRASGSAAAANTAVETTRRPRRQRRRGWCTSTRDAADGDRVTPVARQTYRLSDVAAAAVCRRGSRSPPGGAGVSLQEEIDYNDHHVERVSDVMQ